MKTETIFYKGQFIRLNVVVPGIAYRIPRNQVKRFNIANAAEELDTPPVKTQEKPIVLEPEEAKTRTLLPLSASQL